MKTTTKWTAGPWTTSDEICEMTGSIAVYANGPIVYVKDNGNGVENQRTNARLIAAAPELAGLLADGAFQLGRLSGPDLETYSRTFAALAAALLARLESGL